MPMPGPTGPFVFAVLFAMTMLAPAHAQTSGGTGGGTSGGVSGGSSGTSTSPGTRTSPGPAAIPGQSSPSTAGPSADTIGNARTPSATTRQDTYDRLPDEPGPDYRITPDDPLDNNPAAAAGPRNEFPETRSGDDAGRNSRMVPDAERATRGTDPAQADARSREIRKEKERTAVDTLGECMKAWDPETHISKDKWKETCARTLDEPHL